MTFLIAYLLTVLLSLMMTLFHNKHTTWVTINPFVIVVPLLNIIVAIIFICGAVSDDDYEFSEEGKIRKFIKKVYIIFNHTPRN